MKIEDQMCVLINHTKWMKYTEHSHNISLKLQYCFFSNFRTDMEMVQQTKQDSTVPTPSISTGGIIQGSVSVHSSAEKDDCLSELLKP